MSTGRIRVGIMVALLLAVALAFWPTTASIIVRWTDTLTRAYTHGSLIVLMSAFMLWRRRDAIAAVNVAPAWPAALVTLMLAAAWFFFLRSSVQIAHQFLLPLLWLSSILTVFGWRMFRHVWFPVGFLYFTVPVWDAILPLLQWASVFAVRGALSLLGIPVYFDGLEFQIPSGRFQIADGCSGLHFFIVALAIATFYGDLHDDRWGARVRLWVLAAVFALVTNWVRIAIIIVTGHVTDMQHPLVAQEHYSFGWMLFAVAMAGYFLIVRRWPAQPHPARVDVGAVPGNAVPGLAMAALTLALPAAALRFDSNLADEKTLSPPAFATGPSRAVDPLWPAAPHFAGVDHEYRVLRESDGVLVDAYAGLYRRQEQGRELGGFSNQPLGADLRARSSTRAPAPLATEPWEEIVATDPGGGQWLVWLGYAVGSARFADAGSAQWAYGRASFLGDPLSAVYVLRARCNPGCDSARVALARVAGSPAPTS
jgi:exosortase A